jgi:hypothetical protein
MAAEVTDPVIVSLATGLCGLLGGFAGSWLGRRTEYEKWLRQERNGAFGRFLLKMKDFQWQALDLVLEIKNAPEDEKLDPDIRLSQLKLDFEGEENMVRLYLSESDRDKFSTAVKELQAVYDPYIKQGRRMDTTTKFNKEIRDLFERVLHSNK